ncbi:uncharacterized protein [Choristoneura fumiferana]|uniref:uncharacterized protein n=1 Tax=Choristoneura fumiferana TaxID=7141 RepID=UPI003D159DB6
MEEEPAPAAENPAAGESGDTQAVDGEGAEKVEGEKVEGEHVPGEEVEGEHVKGEQVEGEHVEGEHAEGEEKEKLGEGEELMGEEMEGEFQGEETEEKPPEEAKPEEVVEEEEQYVEEPPPDPAAPYNFSDSSEMLKPKFELRPDQVAEVEQLWAYYQDYTPAYTDIDDYITEKELIYMLKALMLMTNTPEQLQELIEYCVRPPHPEGHISYQQFLKMVTLRQRELPIEEELRTALQVFDPERTGSMNREELKDVLAHQGHKMPAKQLDNLIKEVDMSNDGTIGVEDVVGTMCIDLNPEDLIMLRNAVFPPAEQPPAAEEEF